MQIFSDGFFGKGFSFPVTIDNYGSIKFSSGERSIAQSIYIILNTVCGERLMRPDFGCKAGELVFYPLNSSTCNLLCHYIEEALMKWEPRIIIEKIEAHQNPDHDNRIDVNISYINRIVNTAFNMVYPFYLERGEYDTQSQFR
ncbi:MAG: GPW/gp25 family protein [Spirochaetes bacterium]|nr:GPW/gp25 family protein [Spirochaetota bacterium]